MAISNEPSLTEIQNEFNATSLTDAADKAGLELPVGMRDFIGLSAGPDVDIVITNQTFSDSHSVVSGTASASAQYELRNNAQAWRVRGQGANSRITGEWMQPEESGETGSFQVKGTKVNEDIQGGGGTLGTFGTWQVLSSTRLWGITATRNSQGEHVNSVTVDVEIREGTGPDVIASARIIMSAAVEFGTLD